MAKKAVHQHYIPQLLLRGFSEGPGGGDSKIWVFRRGVEPFYTSTRNVGGERFFYADPAENPVETELAAREAALSRALVEIRADRRISTDLIPAVCELVGQMAARTKNVRQGFAIAGETTIRDALGAMLGSAKFEREVQTKVAEKLQSQGTSLPPDFISRFTASGMSAFRDDFDRRGGIDRLLDEVDVQRTTQTAQVRMLRERLTSIGDRFQTLHWEVLAAKEAAFILGDVGPIAMRRRKKGARPAVMFSPRHDLIVLPVADSVAVVGGAESYSVEEVNIDRLNSWSVKLSLEFFVSRTNGSRERTLQTVLGSEAECWVTEPRRQYKRRLDRLK